jgi:hypothetical protein
LTCPDVELEFLTVDFELARTLFQRLQAGSGGSQLRFEILSLLRQCLYLKADLPDFLIAILQDQQLFELGLHSAKAIE